MTLKIDSLQTLRNFCRDEAAFEGLTQLLATMAVGQPIGTDRSPIARPFASMLDSSVELAMTDKKLQREIIHREQVERALRESEAKYRELVEKANSIILRLDTQGNIIFFNEFAQTFFGYAQEEILGRSAIGTIIPETETLGRDLTHLIQDLIQHPEQYRCHENENICRHGERVWVAWTNQAILDEAGRVTGLLCVGNDITERHLAAEALRASEARYRALSEELERRVQERTAELTRANEQLKTEIWERQRAEIALAKSEAWFKALIQQSTDMIDVLDRDGNYVYVNPPGAIDIGLEPASLIGTSCWEGVHPDDLPLAKAAFAQMLQNPGEPVQLTVRMLHPEGHWMYVEAIGRNLLDDPAVGGIIVNSRDITERKQAQEREQQLIASLQAAKDQLQVVLDTVPGCVSWFNSNLEYEGVNRYLAETFHLTTEDFVGKKLGFTRFNHEFKEFIEQFFASSDREASQEIEMTCDRFPQHYLMVAQKYRQNRAAVCVGLDITELKRTEEALRSSEEKFAKAFRCCPDAITISTLAEGRLIDVNESFLRYFGQQREEWIGRTIGQLNIWVNLEDRDRMLQVLQQQEAVYNQEFEFRTSWGEIRVGLFSAECITIAGEVCVLALVRDITERKQAEAQLLQAASRERLLAEIALRIRRSLDLDEMLNTTVTEVREFLGADRVFIGHLYGSDLGKVVAESVAANYCSILGLTISDRDYLQALREFFQLNGVRAIEDTTQIEMHPKSTEYNTVYQVRALLGVPILLGDEFFGVLIVHQCSQARRWQDWEVDLLQTLATQVAIAIHQGQLYQQTTQLNQQLSELNANLERQVEERTQELQQKMQELQELNKLKDLFLHAVSHDLRTPVVGTLMVLNNLLGNQGTENRGQGDKGDEGDNLPTFQPPQSKIQNPKSKIEVPQSVLERMIQSCDRQLSLINSLLEVRAVQTQGIAVKCKPLQLSQLISEIIADLKPLLVKEQTIVKNQVSEDLPLVSADSAQLWRVFENLITNALKHNPPGVTLTLSATVFGQGGQGDKEDKEDKEDKGEISPCPMPHAPCPKPNPKLKIAIADNGTGMEQAHCDRLFDPYYRGGNTRHLTGIGLGLYLCRQIIEAHGGEIGVNSSPGAGTTFWFTLPLAGTDLR